MKWHVLSLIAPTLLLGVIATSSGKCISKSNDCTLTCPGIGSLDLTDLLTENGAPKVFHLPETNKEFTIPQCFQSESKSSVVLEWSIDAEDSHPFLLLDFVHSEGVVDPSLSRVHFKYSADPYVKSEGAVVVVGSPEVSSVMPGLVPIRQTHPTESQVLSAFSPGNVELSSAVESSSVVEAQSKSAVAAPTRLPTPSPSHRSYTYYNNYYITNPSDPYDYYNGYEFYFFYNNYGYYNSYYNYNTYYSVDYSFTTASYYTSFYAWYYFQAMAYSGTTLAAVYYNNLLVYYCAGTSLTQVALYDLPQREGYSFYNAFASVAIDGTMIVVSNYDCVFTFTYDGGLYQSAPLIEGPYKSWFGYGVAVSNSTLMVSQISTNEVFVYNMSASGSWSLTQTLTGPEYASYGSSVAMSGDLAMVGAPDANEVYAYQKSESSGLWVILEALTTPDGGGSSFGTCLTMDGTTAMISASHNSFIFSFVAVAWNYQNPIGYSGMNDMSLSGSTLITLQDYYFYNYAVSYSTSFQLTPTALPTISISPGAIPTRRPTRSPTHSAYVYNNNYYITNPSNPYDYDNNYEYSYFNNYNNNPYYNYYSNNYYNYYYSYSVDYSLTYASYYTTLYTYGYPYQAMALSGTTLVTVYNGKLYMYYCPGTYMNQVAFYDLPYREGYGGSVYANVDIDGDLIVVSYYDCVFTFSYDGGLYQSAPLIEGPYKSWFGYGVAVSNGTLMISQISTQEVFVYNMSISGSWSLTQTLTGPEGDCFGCSLAMSGDLALVGAPDANVVYAYERTASGNEWAQITTLSVPEGSSNGFGTFLAIDGNTAIIASENYHGFIYSFVGAWNYQNPFYMYGYPVVDMSLSGNTLMILGYYGYYLYNYQLVFSSNTQLTPTTLPTVYVPTISRGPTTVPTRRPTRSPTHGSFTYNNNYYITNPSEPYDYDNSYEYSYFNNYNPYYYYYNNYYNYYNYYYDMDYSFTYASVNTAFYTYYSAQAMAYSGSTLVTVYADKLFVYYYYPGGYWSQMALYDLPTREGYYSYGAYASIAIDGNLIVVSYLDCVFTFTYDVGLYQSAPLIEGPYKSWFGYGVAVSNGTLMVSQISTHEVFVYSMSASGSWSLTQTLTGPEGDCFGCSLAMSGDLALVGAPDANVVYAYLQNVASSEWALISTLSAPADSASGFGSTLTIDANTAVIANENFHGFIYSFVGAWNYQNPFNVYYTNGPIIDMSLSGSNLLTLEYYGYYVISYSVTYSSNTQLSPTALPTVFVPTISSAPSQPTRRPSPSPPTYTPTVSPTEATLYGVTLVQELVGMSASTYNARSYGNDQIFIDAVNVYLGSYIDGVTVLSVVDASSSRRLLRSSGSKEKLSVPSISVTYEVLISSNSYAISSVYSNVYSNAYYMQSYIPYYLYYYGSIYYYSYPNSFSSYSVTSSSLSSISSVYVDTDDDDNSSSSSSKEASTTVVIAAAVGGGGGGVLLIVACVLYYCYCYRKHAPARVPVEEASGVELNHRAFEMAPPLVPSVDLPLSASDIHIPVVQGYVIAANGDQKVV